MSIPTDPVLSLLKLALRPGDSDSGRLPGGRHVFELVRGPRSLVIEYEAGRYVPVRMVSFKGIDDESSEATVGHFVCPTAAALMPPLKSALAWLRGDEAPTETWRDRPSLL